MPVQVGVRPSYKGVPEFGSNGEQTWGSEAFMRWREGTSRPWPNVFNRGLRDNPQWYGQVKVPDKNKWVMVHTHQPSKRLASRYIDRLQAWVDDGGAVAEFSLEPETKLTAPAEPSPEPSAVEMLRALVGSMGVLVESQGAVVANLQVRSGVAHRTKSARRRLSAISRGMASFVGKIFDGNVLVPEERYLAWMSEMHACSKDLEEILSKTVGGNDGPEED